MRLFIVSFLVSTALAATVFTPSTQKFAVSKEIAKKFAPILHFSSLEPSHPCSFEFLLQHATLKSKSDGNFALKHPSSMDAYTYSADSYYLEVDDTTEAHAGHPLQNGEVRAPMYVTAQEHPNYYAINYLFLYSYQGPQVLKIKTPLYKTEFMIDNYGTHQGDLERVTVYVSKDFSKIVKANFAHHSEDTDFDVNDLMLEDGTHTVVKVALNSHASYNPKKQTDSRIQTYKYNIKIVGTSMQALDVIEEDKSKGAVWKPHEHDEDLVFVGLDDSGLVMGDKAWVAFTGRMGASYKTGVKRVLDIDGSRVAKSKEWLIDLLAKIFKSEIPDTFKEADGPDAFGKRDYVKGTSRTQ